MNRARNVLICLTLCLALYIYANTPSLSQNGSPLLHAKSVGLPSYLSESERNNIEIFKRASPSVVNVSSKAIRRNFYDLNVYEVPQGAGTGFIWDDEGHIVTNFHVINQADQVTIKLINQDKEIVAKVVGVSVDKDLAVLKIDVPKHLLKAIPVMGKKPLIVGQKVLAIGNPFGLDHTLTVGVVSALGREIESLNKRKIKGVIQTDAAINPGNSGGPLLNSQGELIGVNTQIVSASGSSAGIGFAVPVDIVRKIVPQLIKYGKVQRVGLGVTVISDVYNQRLGGVMINEVMQGSAAHTAGLQGLQKNYREITRLGDIITSVSGKKTPTFLDLLDVLEAYKAGDEVKVYFIRNEKEMSCLLKLQILETY